MSNSLVVPGFDKKAIAALQKKLGTPEDNDDLTEGMSLGFPVLSIKGKVWRVKSGGEEQALLDADGDPISTLTCVLVKASPHVSKIYYAKAYQEGDDDSPDCFSVDGIRPDGSVAEPQHTSCASCPMNAFGSRITENGSKVKACSDSRRVALLPYPDLSNDDKGPIMLRVPTMSMGNLGKLKSAFKQLNVPYRAAVLKLGFDADKAYPALTFKIVKALNEEEADQVAEWLGSVELEAIFNERVEGPVDSEAEAEEHADEPKDDIQKAREAKELREQKEAKAKAAKDAERKRKAAEKKEAEAKAAAEEEKETPKSESLDQGEVMEDEDELDSLLQDALG